VITLTTDRAEHDVAAEQRRLNTLHSYPVMDPDEDAVLDQMTGTLAQVFQAPISCISFIDEMHVWFKSRFGLELRETVKNENDLCVHTVRSGDVLVVYDLAVHPVFRQNPLVTGDPGLRFYAAAPLIAPNGESLGTICVMDVKPVTIFSDRDRVLLRCFAATVMGHLELRKQASHLHDLAREYSLLADAVNQTDEAVIITDTHLEGPGPAIVYANAAFSKMMGYSQSEIIGNTPRILRGEETDLEVLNRLNAALLANQPFEGETIKYRKDGSRLLVNWKVSPVRGQTGQITNYIATYRDVTGQRAAEKKVAEARDIAEAASRAKSAFLAAMSHEIRTPLNGIIGNAEILADTRLDSQQAEIVTTIRNSGELLLTVVNDILDFSKIEAGRIQLDNIDFSLIDVLRDIVKQLDECAERKNLELTLEVCEDIPDHVIGDAQRLRQVLLNLLTNAFKFTEKGTVSLHVSVEFKSVHKARLIFEIRDTGIGIAAESRDKLFQSFSQADSSMARRYGGTGLGLAITKRLVDLMQGSLILSSELNVGTTVLVTLPFELSVETTATETLEGVLRENEVIVISEPCGWLSRFRRDDPIVTIQSFLDNYARCGSLGDGPRCDRFLLDLTAPGGEIAPQLGKVGERVARSEISVLVLLPSFSRKTVQSLKDAGLKDVISMPLRSKDLTRWLGKDDRPSISVAPKVSFSSIGTRILLAEDNRVNQKLAHRMLQKFGCEVQITETGREAVEALDKGSFDLILMDCQMPEMDGFEATRIIRERGYTIPIVALTAHAVSGDRERCLHAGMDDYLTKPVRSEILAEIIKKWAEK
jgi:two-component system, sensor histidine kinase and response regulator